MTIKTKKLQFPYHGKKFHEEENNNICTLQPPS